MFPRGKGFRYSELVYNDKIDRELYQDRIYVSLTTSSTDWLGEDGVVNNLSHYNSQITSNGYPILFGACTNGRKIAFFSCFSYDKIGSFAGCVPLNSHGLNQTELGNLGVEMEFYNGIPVVQK